MAEYGSNYGKLVTSPKGFAAVNAALGSLRVSAAEQAEREQKISFLEAKLQGDPKDHISVWAVLAKEYHNAGRFKDSEQALNTSSQLARAKDPAIATAGWNAQKDLGKLYFAALSNSTRGKGTPVWGYTPSTITPESLGYTSEKVRVLAQQYLGRCDEVAKATGMWGVVSYVEMLMTIMLATQATTELSDAAFQEYDDFVASIASRQHSVSQ
jgi:hypothetical protein